MNAQAAQNSANKNAKAAEIKALLNKPAPIINPEADESLDAALGNPTNVNTNANGNVKPNLSNAAYSNIKMPNTNNSNMPNLSKPAYANIEMPKTNNNVNNNWREWARKGLDPLQGRKSKQTPRLSKKPGSRKLVPKNRR